MTAQAAGPRFDALSALTSLHVGVSGAVVLNSSAFGRIHHCSGSSGYTVTLPAVSGNDRKLIGFKFDALTGGAIVTLDGNGAETIDQGFHSNTTRMYVASEECVLLCDGSKWLVLEETFSQPTFRVRRVANQGLADGVAERVDYDTVDFDYGGFWDAVNYKYTPKVPGYYQFLIVQYTSSSVPDKGVIRPQIDKNGATLGFFNYRSGAAGSWSWFYNNVTYMNGTTDYVEGWAYVDQAAGTIGEAGAQQTSLYGVRLGRGPA